MKCLLAAVIAAALIAGCGSQSIESRVQAQYHGYATRHGFNAKVRNADQVTCTHDATRAYDGWCSITPYKNAPATYDVPYKGQTVYWGNSGLMKAPDS